MKKKLLLLFVSSLLVVSCIGCGTKKVKGGGSSIQETTVNYKENLNGNTYNGTNYNLTVNDKWTIMEKNTGGECAFTYNDEELGDYDIPTSIGVSVVDFPQNTTFDELINQTRKGYESVEGATIESQSFVEVCGIDGVMFKMKFEQDQLVTILEQKLVEKDGKLFMINVTYMPDRYDAVKDEINAVLDTLEIL